VDVERFVELPVAHFGDGDVDGASVAWTELALNETGTFKAVNQSRRAPGRVDNGVSNLGHLQSPVGGPSQLQKNLKPGEWQIARGFELETEAARESSIGFEQKSKEDDAIVP
jgi:hypothetical protein